MAWDGYILPDRTFCRKTRKQAEKEMFRGRQREQHGVYWLNLQMADADVVVRGAILKRHTSERWTGEQNRSNEQRRAPEGARRSKNC
jgi:hypothetical protein